MNGFSTKTCLPFSSAALASSKWVQTGVITATASMWGERTISDGIGGDLYARMSFPGAFQGGGIGIADGGQLTAVGGLEVPGHHGSPVTISNDPISPRTS